MRWQPAVIGMGSNLGDRRANLAAAVAALRVAAGVRVVRASRPVRTAPVGYRRQPWFDNAAVLVRTRLPPRALLARMRSIEAALGRRRSRRFGPRTIDLDLLLYGARVIRSRALTVPHPRMHERAFVLLPAAAVAGTMRHPLLGSSLRTLARRARQP